MLCRIVDLKMSGSFLRDFIEAGMNIAVLVNTRTSGGKYILQEDVNSKLLNK